MAIISPERINFGQQATNAIAAAIASAVIDAATEYTRAPFLNDQAPVGGANMSMSEILLYGSGAFLSVFGLFAAITRKKIAGIGSDMIGTGLGTIAGTFGYESYGATALGIRK